jgi:tRNA-specific 2-thiouridylase
VNNSTPNLSSRVAGKKVLLALSGGVDSSLAAHLLLEAGAEVTGTTFRNYCFGEETVLPERSCCSVESVRDARRVCDTLNIEHRVIDETERFELAVIDNFQDEYSKARTPNPCVRCNTEVRFPRLMEEALRGGFDLVATGHYARILPGDPWQMACGLDSGKDQSYFLAGLAPEFYPLVVFPLGAMQKTEVRSLARAAGLHVAGKKESQDICFLGGSSLADYLRQFGALHPGEIIGPEGNVLGEHPGMELFTIGQRHGLGVAAGRPLYVRHMDAETGRITLGEESDLLCRELRASSAWFRPGSGLRGRVRYRSEAQRLESVEFEDGWLRVKFEEPVSAVAPGQSLVLYDGDRVAGHGIIESSMP